jgi:hypothetical protein
VSIIVVNLTGPQPTGYADWVIHGENGVILETPMAAEGIERAFKVLTRLIECPVRTPEELRSCARNVDDDVILEKLLENFLTVKPNDQF